MCTQQKWNLNPVVIPKTVILASTEMEKELETFMKKAGKGKDPAALLELGKVFYGGHLSQKPTKHYGLCGCMYLKFLNAEKGNWPPNQP